MLKHLDIIAICIGGWMVLNGILHDIAILNSRHGKKYGRELLRLLMDGHILITCGIMQMISFIGLRSNQPWGYYVAGVASISLLIYCAMIFPFLKSIGTILLNLTLLILLVINLVLIL